jgi:hypothetical protein
MRVLGVLRTWQRRAVLDADGGEGAEIDIERVQKPLIIRLLP